MNKNRTILLVISTLCILFGLVFLLFQVRDINLRRASTDSGFDSSWDSGGSSSHDHSSSYHSSSGGSSHSSGGGGHIDPITNIICIAILLATCEAAIVIIIFIFIQESNVNKTIANTLNIYEDSYNNRKFGEKEEDLLIREYHLTEQLVVDKAYESYVKIQEAWANNDIEPARKYLSDELYNQYKSQLISLVAKKQRNAMHGFSFERGFIDSIVELKDSLQIYVILNVKCYDYLISVLDGMVLRGSSDYLNDYTYKLSFLVSKESKMITNCPNCDAKIEGDAASVTCTHCGSVINRKTTGMILERKEMLLQK